MAATITVTGLDEAVKELTDIAGNFRERAKEFSNDLGKIAAEEAQAHYGTWDVTVKNVPDKRRAATTVTATGNRDLKTGGGVVVGSNILLAEFGAGVLAGDHEWAQEVPDVYPGSYSSRYGTGEFAATGAWHWGGRVFTYVNPTRGLWHGATLSEIAAEGIAKVVFRK